jgi:hypothetical protein
VLLGDMPVYAAQVRKPEITIQAVNFASIGSVGGEDVRVRRQTSEIKHLFIYFSFTSITISKQCSRTYPLGSVIFGLYR